MAALNAEAGPSSPHEIRITNHGKINNWVSFALEHLQKYEDRPLVLHTLPAPKANTPATGEQTATAVAEKKAGSGLHPSMATIPRLVSVVEIIKREYLKTLDPALAESGSLSGLHQYNEVGDLAEAGYEESEGSGRAEQDRQESLARALQGRNHVQQKKIAFMRVTLARKQIPALAAHGATYQSPAVRKLNKNVRARLRKKKAKEAGAAAVTDSNASNSSGG
ncbi:hypothetical protein L226DRAFT_555248 [Lentinus tigrinus ALCF2SS1-7]|uniref:Uncharacterized protein n=1 Tax=Lentinus tigrinus ALCF2SS1-6 TaxID=1328759 RepID=A0A5C2RSK7_9APHY|nr:hypothetical protein L227DRAFT_511869 [Lentinus tigrinus ALCF2SS1-6]RPD69312.1 hypothetical protein L226DRAFT_555248 [Lentinus tigrinus ALCF2SS1-7]